MQQKKNGLQIKAIDGLIKINEDENESEETKTCLLRRPNGQLCTKVVSGKSEESKKEWFKHLHLVHLKKEFKSEIALYEKVVEVIKKIYDPEIPVNIYELGLIYKIEIIENKKANVEMTLTSPNCPVAESLPNMVKENILKLDQVSDVDLKLVWDPPWSKDMMSEAAKLELNL